MILAPLLIAFASAGQPATGDTPEVAPKITSVDDVDTALMKSPWRQYRLRPVLHPTVDVEFLTLWEPAFLRRNRMASAGLGMATVGAISLVGGFALTWSRGDALGPTLMGVGAASMVAAPFLGIAGSLGAARILRAGGVDVSRNPAWLGVASLSVAGLGIPALVGYPLALLFPLLQSGVNGMAFRQAMGRAPRTRVSVNPLPLREGAGLAIAATW